MKRKTVVITGSARGLGFEMAKSFYHKNFNVVISDVKRTEVDIAKKELEKEKKKGRGKVISIVCDVTKRNDIVHLIDKTKYEFSQIDIWINNAGINQSSKLTWDMNYHEIVKLIDTNLLGTMMSSSLVMAEMSKHGSGAIYNVDGYGNKHYFMPRKTIYDTTSKGIVNFTSLLAKEAEMNKVNVIIGSLSPGIVLTDFLVKFYDNEKVELSNKTKRLYNVLGDNPESIAKYFVNKIINNTDNNIRIKWLTLRKIVWKYLVSVFKKNKYFN